MDWPLLVGILLVIWFGVTIARLEPSEYGSTRRFLIEAAWPLHAFGRFVAWLRDDNEPPARLSNPDRTDRGSSLLQKENAPGSCFRDGRHKPGDVG